MEPVAVGVVAVAIGLTIVPATADAQPLDREEADWRAQHLESSMAAWQAHLGSRQPAPVGCLGGPCRDREGDGSGGRAGGRSDRGYGRDDDGDGSQGSSTGKP